MTMTTEELEKETLDVSRWDWRTGGLVEQTRAPSLRERLEEAKFLASVGMTDAEERIPNIEKAIKMGDDTVEAVELIEDWIDSGDGNWREATIISKPTGWRVWLKDETEGTFYRNETMLPTLPEATKHSLALWKADVDAKALAAQKEADTSIDEGDGACWVI